MICLSHAMYDWGYILYLVKVRHSVTLSVNHLFVGLVMVQEEDTLIDSLQEGISYLRRVHDFGVMSMPCMTRGDIFHLMHALVIPNVIHLSVL